MIRKVLLAMPLVFQPSLTFAEPGSGTDLYRVNRQVEAMQRDGRWEQLLAEAQAVKRSTPAQTQRSLQPTAVFTTITPPARRRR